MGDKVQEGEPGNVAMCRIVCLAHKKKVLGLILNATKKEKGWSLLLFVFTFYYYLCV